MTTTSTAAPVTSRTAGAALALGLVAMLLTTTLAFISLALGALGLLLGAQAVRRLGPSVAAVVGMTAASSSIYVIVLEILVVGG